MPAKTSTRSHISEGTDAINDSQINIEELVREVLQFDVMLKGISQTVKKAIAPFEKRIDELEIQLSKLQIAFDDLSTYNRRTNLRFNGIAEDIGKDTDQLIINICAKIDIDINKEDISVSHRIGKINNSMGQRPRAIIVRLLRYRIRQMIVRNKKKLECGISINEDLTKLNLSIFKYARSKCVENKRIYTSNSKVMYNDGKKRLHLYTRGINITT
ncbi:unnamed protein product [Didymodactylos carnosus]|uniref:Uncharacterized protein n=1 Tax=Didymodactylos carnosus TaxID=1234261 RepID=A0A815UWY7_9BILA|nr:unnamed protein product [Didymodactylos carnosus]CAF1526608.1 unnamed protein product [Didymodactylos carnosus]CAF3726978.1 unnamed protein product [Didymodactylos carnosus]CAF4385663.1 unnamed protein product [Didymodactylos carnosus]